MVDFQAVVCDKLIFNTNGIDVQRKMCVTSQVYGHHNKMARTKTCQSKNVRKTQKIVISLCLLRPCLLRVL